MEAAFAMWETVMAGTGVHFKKATTQAEKGTAASIGIVVTVGTSDGDPAETERTSVSGIMSKAVMRFDLNNTQLFDRSKTGWNSAVLKVMLHEIGHTVGLDGVTPKDCSQQNGTSVMTAMCNVNNQPNDSGGQMSVDIKTCDQQRARVFTDSGGGGGGGGGGGECRDADGCLPGGVPGWGGVNCHSEFDCDGDGWHIGQDCDDYDATIGFCVSGLGTLCPTSGCPGPSGGTASDGISPVTLNGAGLAVRNCQNYSELAPVVLFGLDACISYCEATNADACEWHLVTGNCYSERGDYCELQGNYPGWYGYLIPEEGEGGGSGGGGGGGGGGGMAQDSAIRNCSNYVEMGAVYQPDSNACLSYCQGEGADACEWHAASGNCYAEFGDGCTVEGVFSGWFAAVINPESAAVVGPAAQVSRRVYFASPTVLIGTAAFGVVTVVAYCLGLFVMYRSRRRWRGGGELIEA